MNISNHKRGEVHHYSKLTNDEVLEIKELSKKGYSLNTLASEFGVCKSTIFKITHGKLWAHVLLLRPLTEMKPEEFKSAFPKFKDHMFINHNFGTAKEAVSNLISFANFHYLIMSVGTADTYHELEKSGFDVRFTLKKTKNREVKKAKVNKV